MVLKQMASCLEQKLDFLLHIYQIKFTMNSLFKYKKNQ